MADFEGIQNYADQLTHDREQGLADALAVGIAYLVGNFVSRKRGRCAQHGGRDLAACDHR
jgi:hypothetical protein